MCGTPLETDAGAEALAQQDLEKAKQAHERVRLQGRADHLDGSDGHPGAARRLSGDGATAAQNWGECPGAGDGLEHLDLPSGGEKEPPTEGGWHLFHTYGTGADMASPINNITMSGGCEEKAWFGWPCDERLEKLRDDWARATEPAKQKDIAIEIQRVAYDMVPYVNYGQWFLPTAYHSNLKGVIVSPSFFLPLLLEYREGVGRTVGLRHARLLDPADFGHHPGDGGGGPLCLCLAAFQVRVIRRR